MDRQIDALIEAIRGATATLAAGQQALAQALGEAVRLLAERPAGAAPAPSPAEDRLLTVREAAEWLRASEFTVYRYLKARRLAFVACGRKKLIALRDLEAFCRRRRTKALDSHLAPAENDGVPVAPVMRKEA